MRKLFLTTSIVAYSLMTFSTYAVQYDLTIIDHFGDSNDYHFARKSTATDINNSGQVIGTAYDPDAPHTNVGYILDTTTGTTTKLDVFPASVMKLCSINESGQIAGYYQQAPNNVNEQAFVWENGLLKDLSTLGGTISQAYDINDNGEIAGYSYIPSGFYTNGYPRATYWESTSADAYDVGDLKTSMNAAYACAINNNGVVAGYSYTDTWKEHAFLWSGDENDDPVDIDINGQYSYPTAINDSGIVVGYAMENDYDADAYAVAWDVDNNLIVLPTLAGATSLCHDVNEDGVIVGYADYDPNIQSRHAVVWIDGVIYDLNDCIESSEYELAEAYGINDLGQIVGVADYTYWDEANSTYNTTQRGFILNLSSVSSTPIPEPASCIMLIMGLAGLIHKRLRK